MKAARDTLAGFKAEIDKADAAIAMATVKIPKLGTALDDAGTRGARGIGRATDGVGSAKKAADDLKRSLDEATQKAQTIMDRLFPDDARQRQYVADFAALDAAYKRGAIGADQLAEALRRLRNELRDQSVDYKPDTGITEPVTQVWSAAQSTGELMSDTWGEVGKANDRLIENFAGMARDVAGSLQGLVNNFRSKDWLGAMSSILDVIGQISGFLRGTGTPAIRTFPVGGFNPGASMPVPMEMSLSGARAMGGPVMPHGSYLVGEQGPEIVRMGSVGGSVIPNHALGGPTTIHVAVEEGALFRPVVRSEAGQVSYSVARESARAGALRNRQVLS